MNKANFKCKGDELDKIPKEILDNSNIKFPEAYREADELLKLSKEFKRFNKDRFCRLPFCHTIEGETLGATVNLGDGKIGPRVNSFAFDDIEKLNEHIKSVAFEESLADKILDMVKVLKNQGERVILNISGPITVIDSLIGSKALFKALRKNKVLALELLESVEEFIVLYMEKAIDSGVDIISYGDPLGTLDILGPKTYKEVAGKSTINILSKIYPQLGNTIIHLCGRNSVSLEECELVSIDVDEVKGEDINSFLGKEGNEKVDYGDVLLYAIDSKRVKIIGHNCIKRTILPMKKLQLWKVEIL